MRFSSILPLGNEHIEPLRLSKAPARPQDQPDGAPPHPYHEPVLPPLHLLKLFIRKIVVHETDTKRSKHVQQMVEILCNDIGYVELTQPEGQSPPERA